MLDVKMAVLGLAATWLQRGRQTATTLIEALDNARQSRDNPLASTARASHGPTIHISLERSLFKGNVTTFYRHSFQPFRKRWGPFDRRSITVKRHDQQPGNFDKSLLSRCFKRFAVRRMQATRLRPLGFMNFSLPHLDLGGFPGAGIFCP